MAILTSRKHRHLSPFRDERRPPAVPPEFRAPGPAALAAGRRRPALSAPVPGELPAGLLLRAAGRRVCVLGCHAGTKPHLRTFTPRLPGPFAALWLPRSHQHAALSHLGRPGGARGAPCGEPRRTGTLPDPRPVRLVPGTI